MRIIVHLYRLPDFREQSLLQRTEFEQHIRAAQATLEAHQAALETDRAALEADRAAIEFNRRDADALASQFENLQIERSRHAEILENRLKGHDADLEVSNQWRHYFVQDFNAFKDSAADFIATAQETIENAHQSMASVRTFQDQQLPSIVNSISDLSMRQQAQDQDAKNLARSIPVTLRHFKAEFKAQNAKSDALQSDLEGLSHAQDDLIQAHATFADKQTMLEAAQTSLNDKQQDFSAILDQAVQSQSSLSDQHTAFQEVLEETQNTQESLRNTQSLLVTKLEDAAESHIALSDQQSALKSQLNETISTYSTFTDQQNAYTEQQKAFDLKLAQAEQVQSAILGKQDLFLEKQGALDGQMAQTVQTQLSLVEKQGSLESQLTATNDQQRIHHDMAVQIAKDFAQSLTTRIDQTIENFNTRSQKIEATQTQTSEGVATLQADVQTTSDTIQQQMQTVAKLMQSYTELSETHQSLAEAIAKLEAEQTAQGERNAVLEEQYYPQINFLTHRLEFIRKELIYEMRYGLTSAQDNADLSDVKTEIIDVEKVDRAKKDDNLKLNIGCGHITLDGYINVDRRKLAGIDVVADVRDLPVKEGEVTEIHSAHVLEHFPEEQLKRELLPYWIGLLKKGGIFRAVVPDAEAMIEGYSTGDYPYEHLREVTFGSQDYDGDFHFNMFTPDSLTDILTEAGLKDVQVVEKGRVNGACMEFEITGRKS